MPQDSGFVEKAARASCKKGVHRAGEHQSRKLLRGRPGQNQITEYRKMLQAWRKAGALSYAGYILELSQRYAGID
jgi:hypothetical protein